MVRFFLYHKFSEHNGEIYCIFHGQSVPTSVPKYIPFDPDNTDLPDVRTFRQLHYRHDHDFYLAFMHKSREFHHRSTFLANCLNYTEGSFPIHSSNSGYSVSSTLSEKWSNLESLLHSVILSLQALTYRTQPLYLTIYWPRSYGYQKTHRTYRKAQNAAWRSHEAFLAVLAYVTFLLHKNNKDDRRDGASWDDWLKQKGFPISVISELDHWRALAAFPEKYIGAFIHPYKTTWNPQWHTDLLHVSRAVPLWIPYGPLSAAPADVVLPDALLPSLENIKSLNASSSYQLLAPAPAPAPSPSPLPLTTTSDNWKIQRLYRLRNQDQYPEPNPHSGQLRGETCEQFLQRRAAIGRKREAEESETQRNARQQRQSQFDSPQGQVMPSARGSTSKLFYWEIVQGVEGYRQRTRVDKALWEDFWRNRRGQRRYDSFFNEWDICSEFGDDAERWEDEDDEDEEFAGCQWDGEQAGYQNVSEDVDMHDGTLNDGPVSHVAGDVVFGPGTNLLASTPDPRARARELSAVVSSTHVVESNRTISAPDSVSSILLFMYGLHSQSYPSTVEMTVTLLTANTALGLTRASPEAGLHTLLRCFVSNPVRQTSPADLNLLRPSSLNVKIVCTSYHHGVWDLFGVRKGSCYIVDSEEPARWRLVVDNAAVAVLIIRHRWGPNIRDVVAELLKRGVAFHTYFSRPTDLAYNDAHHHLSLSWRQIGLGKHYDSPGLAGDYNSYVNVRNNFLQETHACRAALLYGGIVWRIAMDALGYEYALDEVLRGPSEDCVDFGGIPQYLVDGTELWDDALSEDELDLICGVYKDNTSKFCQIICMQCLDNHQIGVQHQTPDVSWWPNATVWSRSGLDVGYWSYDCETWYQTRRSAILADDTKVGKLRNATQWRNSLKFVRKRSHDIQDANVAFSAALLASTL